MWNHSFGLLAALCVTTGVAQPILSYLIPDIGAPGMAVYVEFVAPNSADLDGSNFSATDGIFLNNGGDGFRIELVRPADTTKIVFGPCIVSWYGRLVSTIAFISPTATPNSSDWRQLSPEWRIPIRIRTPNGTTAVDTFYIVQPTPVGDLRNRTETVLGRPPLGVRSRRGALLFDSLILGARVYTIATDDPDGNATNGNQGYLPAVVMAQGPIRGVSPTLTRLSIDANGSDGGPGGGGGGGEFCDIAGGGSPGGNGFTGGGRGGNNSPNSYRAPGIGTGPNGSALNQTSGGTDGGAYESAGGGTGHPFGASGVGCSSGPDCSPDGARGGASGVSDNRDGAGGGYATDGAATSTGANNGGKSHGDVTLVPLAGGSGGASGNPRNTSFPFTACGGRGGGGGGALALIGATIENLSVTANGADGSGSGTASSRRGGSGSGGGVHLASHTTIETVTLTAIGGGQSAPTGKGGAGRIRYDAPETPIANTQPSPYRGPAMDTITVAQGDVTIGGGGTPGKTILLFAKPSNGVWELIDSTTVNAAARWQYRVRAPLGADYLYLVAAQRETPLPTTRFIARPTAILSPAAARTVRILSAPLEAAPNPLDFGRVSCATGDTYLDSIIVRNPGTRSVSITSGNLTPGSGFQILQPQPLQGILPPGQTLTIVVQYRLHAGRYGMQTDTLVIRGGSPENVLLRIPLRVIVDSAGVVLTTINDSMPVNAIDFAGACKGISKERSFAIRVAGAGPATIQRITTTTAVFSIAPLTRTSVNGGDTVHLHLRAVPPDIGDFFDTLTIAVDVCNQVLTIPLRVRGITTRLMAIGTDRDDVVDFGSVRVGVSQTRRIGIVNPSSSDSVVVGPPTMIPQMPFRWQTFPPGRTFPLSVAPQDTLWLELTFSPSGIGNYRDSLIITTLAIGLSCPDTLRFILIGQGTLSAVVPNKAAIDFGTLACGTRTDTVWFKNTGNSPADVLFPATISGNDATYFRIIQQPINTVTLGAGDSLRIIIEARIFPQNSDGIKTAVLEVNVRDDSTRTISVPLQVLQQALVLEFSPQPYVLSDVPINFSSQSQPPLTVRNLSSVEACIADVRATRPEIQPLLRTITIPPYSASRDLYFRITPTSLNPIDDTITIVLACPCVDSIKIPIRIIPTNNALAITPRPLDFGVLPPCSTARRVLTLKNNDPRSNATLEELAISGNESRLFRITSTPWATLPYTIPPGFSFSVEIEFNAAGTRPGMKTADMIVRYVINGEEVLDTIRMIGERTVPVAADSALDFGEVKQGDTHTIPLRLENNYTRSMTFTFAWAQWPQYFAVAPSVLNVDVVTKHATADVEFNAQEIGQFNDTLWVKFTSLGMNCTDSIPVLVHAVSIPGIGFFIWLDSSRVLNPRDRNVALNIYARLDTAMVLPNAQLLLVLDVPNQLFMPTGVQARGGRIQSFNSRNHNRHNITITIDTLLNPLSQEPHVLAQLIGDAMLGDRQCDSIFIIQARWTNSGLKPTTWLNPGGGNGQLCLTLCGAGGPRLLGSELQLPLLQIQPNPVEEVAAVTITANERGFYTLEVRGLDGRALLMEEIGYLSAGISRRVLLNLSSYATGVYWIRLQTPSQSIVQPIIRVR